MKHSFLLFSALILLFAFTAQQLMAMGNTNTSSQFRQMEIITAHRGSSDKAPENTMSSVLQAIEDGAGFAEIDVQETADGVLVLYHDDSLKKIGINRAIWEMNFLDLTLFDVGRSFNNMYKKETIPTLESVMNVASHKIKLNIELKTKGNQPHLVQKVVDMIHEHHFVSQCIVTSFDAGAIAQVKQLDSNIKTGLIIGSNSLITEDMYRAPFDIISIRGKYVNRKLMRNANKYHKEVHAWTINNKQEMIRLLNQGVTSIITDHPAKLVHLIHNRY